jgi:hypothetical protein
VSVAELAGAVLGGFAALVFVIAFLGEHFR